MGHGLQVLVELLRVTISMMAKIWVLVRDCLTKAKLKYLCNLTSGIPQALYKRRERDEISVFIKIISWSSNREVF